MQLLYSWILVKSLGYTKYPSILSQPYLIGISPKAIFIANNPQGEGWGGTWGQVGRRWAAKTFQPWPCLSQNPFCYHV